MLSSFRSRDSTQEQHISFIIRVSCATIFDILRVESNNHIMKVARKVYMCTFVGFLRLKSISLKFKFDHSHFNRCIQTKNYTKRYTDQIMQLLLIRMLQEWPTFLVKQWWMQPLFSITLRVHLCKRKTAIVVDLKATEAARLVGPIP